MVLSAPMSIHKSAYLTKQIIAYIGNKRNLLGLIHSALQRCLGHDFKGKYFLDLFAGSGVVSRLAKALGFRVFCNDWEFFSYVINSAYIGVDKNETESFYKDHGGVRGMVDYLNRLPDPGLEDLYIARCYCPPHDNIHNVDYQTERLFYTRSNGLIIDKIRNEIERLYPREKTEADRQALKEKYLLLALLLYESATHTNTSGVFKAYHKGFGGHNRDALTRILARIELKPPVLIDSAFSHQIFMRDANKLVCSDDLRNTLFDVAYLDPPYNQHQYGSNYHLLNTIARWDKPPVNTTQLKNGKLVDKAGIRKDWTNTRSAYCYRESAVRAFGELLANVEARHILLSYSTEGIIPFEELYRICAARGRVDAVTNEYIKYRGGRQSMNRLNDNIELVLIIDTRKKHNKKLSSKVNELLLRKKLSLQLKKRYRRELLRGEFELDERTERVIFARNGNRYEIPTKAFFELEHDPSLAGIAAADLRLLLDKLRMCQCEDKREELEQLMKIINNGKKNNEYFVRQVPRSLRKIAHKKYTFIFREWLERIRRLEKTHKPLYAVIKDRIDQIEVLARKRFEG
ncbi:MAG: DNA adenine methylase [Spirochaetales bacterium]|nr:DNA adenine methylase [Spirochaetales bacterium]